MHDTLFPSQQYPDDVATIELADKTILLVGTAHISQQSTDLVTAVINQERPDAVCIELDEKRYAALARRRTWENLDLKQVVRSKQLTTLMANLILATYQKKLGMQLGVIPGTELLAGARVAEQLQIPVTLCDRDLRVTLRRAWRATSLFKKGYLLASLISSLFDRSELSEEELAKMRRRDVLSELIREMAAALPQTKEVLIDERDLYMAEQIKATPGRRLVAVVGAGHMEGILAMIGSDNSHRLAEISEVPPSGRMVRLLAWLIPGLILAALLAIGWQQGAAALTANARYWILANGIPAAFGALLALAHPLTIVAAFAAAPLTSLTPLIGAGYVCAFIQVMTCPPMVREFEAFSRDIGRFKGWWQNRLLRIFLVFFLTTLGSALGTWLGGYRIFSSLLS